jgi:hypothetical protein
MEKIPRPIVNRELDFGHLRWLSNLFSVICTLSETALYVNPFRINHITPFRNTEYSSVPRKHLTEFKRVNPDFKRILVTAKQATRESVVGNTACP